MTHRRAVERRHSKNGGATVIDTESAHIIMVDVVVVKESLRGKGPVYVFRDAGIELRQTDVGTLTEAIRGVREMER